MKEDRTHIVLVEDDSAVRLLMLAYLEKAGFRVSEASSAAAFYPILDRGGVDLVLLDLTLPDDDGMEIARRLRRCSDVPVIMVTARARDSDRIAGLELGADDYVTKPFHPRELVARVNNLLQRVKGHAPEDRSQGDAASGVYSFAGFTLDLTQRSLRHNDDGEVSLTRGELDLLAALVRAAGRVLSRDQLIDAVSRRSDPPLERTIDVMVSRLRHKLETEPHRPALLLTVPGAGYRLEM